MALLGGAVGWFWSPDPLSPMTYAWVGIMTGLIVGIVVGIVYSALRGAGASSSAATEPVALRPRSSEHQRLIDLWEQAYYCRKHDAVILPDEPRMLSPTEFRSLMTGEKEGAASDTTPDQERHSRP